MQIKATDQQLKDINSLGGWWTEQTDQTGRIIGCNERPESVDWKISGLAWKIARIQDRLDLAGKKVLELGCLDGANTVSLCAIGADVTAMDVRPGCLVKAMLRCAAFGFSPRFALGDARSLRNLSKFDLLVHAGVLYHLSDPVSHVFGLAKHGIPIVLDTNLSQQPNDELQGYRGHWQAEGGWDSEVSGLEPRSFWLGYESLMRLMADAGFKTTEWWVGELPNGRLHGIFYLEPAQASAPALEAMDQSLDPSPGAAAGTQDDVDLI